MIQDGTCVTLCPSDMKLSTNGNRVCVCIDQSKVMDPETGKCTKNFCEDGMKYESNGGAGQILF